MNSDSVSLNVIGCIDDEVRNFFCGCYSVEWSYLRCVGLDFVLVMFNWFGISFGLFCMCLSCVCDILLLLWR